MNTPFASKVNSVYQKMVAPERNRRNVWLAYLFWLLSGPFGLHRIYVGYRKSGVIMFSLGVSIAMVSLAIILMDPMLRILENTLYDELIKKAVLFSNGWVLFDFFATYFLVKKWNKENNL